MEFKNKKEATAFVLMNILGMPFTMIAVVVYTGWIGLIIEVALFYTAYRLWKYYGKHNDAKLTISPNFTFGNKKLFNER
jgi:hypothetical protein